MHFFPLIIIFYACLCWKCLNYSFVLWKEIAFIELYTSLLAIFMIQTWAIIKVSGHQYRWLAGGYDLEIGHF